MNLTTLRRDIEEGIKQGIVYVEKGVAYVRDKAGELSEEGKKQYRVFTLKTKMQKDISELGAKVYALSAEGAIKPVHEDVRKVIARIQKAEADLAKLEKGGLAVPDIKASKRSSVKKQPAGRTPAKKAGAAGSSSRKRATPKRSSVAAKTVE